MLDYILTPEEHALAEKFHDRQATEEDLELLVSMGENIKKDLKENQLPGVFLIG